MNIKRMIALLLALCLALSLCACGGSQEEPDAPEQTEPAAENVADAPDAPAQEPVQEETEPSGINYTVTVQDEGGNPIAGAMIQICQGEICLMPTATDENGVAVFTVAEEAEYEAKFLALPAGYEYTTDEQVFHFDSNLELTITLKAVA